MGEKTCDKCKWKQDGQDGFGECTAPVPDWAMPTEDDVYKSSGLSPMFSREMRDCECFDPKVKPPINELHEPNGI